MGLDVFILNCVVVVVTVFVVVDNVIVVALPVRRKACQRSADYPRIGLC